MLKKHLLAATVAALAVMMCCAPAMASTTISTSLWGEYDLRSFGESSTENFGQTFTAPAESRLNDWTFHLMHIDGSNTKLRFYVMAWDGSKATGDVLFRSGEYVISATTMTPYTFNVGVNLVAGNQYVAFISASECLDGAWDKAAMGRTMYDSAYSGGRCYFVNDFNNVGFDVVRQSHWTQPGFDAAFTANFSAPQNPVVPEPTALLLGSLGMGSLGMIMRRRR